MNSPYMGNFKVTQRYNPNYHNGLDLVGIDSKEIHSTVNGTVIYSGWENNDDKYQGFGKYVCIRFTYEGKDAFAYFGHLSEIKVETGQRVKITDVIGIEGSTGNSTGSHCHYEVRRGFFKGAEVIDICKFSNIENTVGNIQNDGYSPSTEPKYKMTKTPNKNEIIITW